MTTTTMTAPAPARVPRTAAGPAASALKGYARVRTGLTGLTDHEIAAVFQDLRTRAADADAPTLGQFECTLGHYTAAVTADRDLALARRRGIPILVFVKNTDEADDPEQTAFKKLVGDYVDGRFWKTFNGPTDLNISVGEALKALPVPGAPLRLQPVAQPPQVPWLQDTGLRPAQVDAPVLEIHLLPIPTAGTPWLVATVGLDDQGRPAYVRIKQAARAFGKDSFRLAGDWTYRAYGNAAPPPPPAIDPATIAPGADIAH